MGSRRGFICRMKVGNIAAENMAVGHLNRLKQRNSLGPGRDGQNYAVVHCTGYIKNWPPTGTFRYNILHIYVLCTYNVFFFFSFHYILWYIVKMLYNIY